ncbi:helix-turn-helix domain-containing protein [Lactococcus lactis]|uniref:helix-turn-helix domain-containing protein n=1 Tax=Lactococcus lactis TaxID=1358 RepID=UPI0009B8A631|nr:MULTISPECIES: helix-turn-helix transcriptional regulator [Lactococcus]MRM77533.1 helix-turn-helix domain-containing protein [Lactococcus cremoris]WBM77879.1 helix-turn-helix domain-containing protein [Lactococcus lactis]WSP32339.1 helix-turn-helix transcriptional regulator [Lactococcus lactis subsp. lactis]
MAKNRIKELRKKNKLTLKELSEKLKDYGLTFSDSQLSQYEQGKRSPRNDKLWEVLSEIFDVNISYLLGVSDSVIPNFKEMKERLDNDEILSNEIRITKYKLYFNAINFLSDQNLSKVNSYRKQYISTFINYITELDNESSELSESELEEIEDVVDRIYEYMRDQINEHGKKGFEKYQS